MLLTYSNKCVIIVIHVLNYTFIYSNVNKFGGFFMIDTKKSETVNRVYPKSGGWRVYPKSGELRVKSEELSLSGNYLNAINIENIKKTHSRNFSTLKPKAAFTLAEVLITLGVIGVVAAITMPMLITNINDRANSERHANIAYKMTQAMEQMRAHGKLTAYDSTSAFVDELQKYLKITKRCDADHIAECWPTDTVVNAAGDEYDVSTCKTRAHLLPESDSTDENVGLILADGASVILTYDPTAAPMDIGDKITASNKSLPVGKNKTKDFAYTTDVTRSIDFVTDVNGKKGPNSETRENKYYDIRNFKLAQFSDGCTGETGSYGCIKMAGAASNWSPVNCSLSASGTDDYRNYCGPNPSGWSTDYWAGAKKLCAEAGMQLFASSNLYSAWKRGEYSTELASVGSNYSWTGLENPDKRYAQAVNFNSGAVGHYSKGSGGNIAVLCRGQ